jgi:ubiquinol-cytochrome c reductase cytochrome c subunit
MTAVEVGPSHMPSFAFTLSVAQMRSVADFVTHQLAVIPLDGGDVGQGGKAFRVYCAPCHRTAVRGGALAFTGINAPDLSEKSPALIAGAIRWGPGPMPSFPPSIIDDRQLASIVEYVKFVQHPPNPGGSPLNWYGPVAEGFAAWVVMFTLIAVVGWIEKGGKG